MVALYDGDGRFTHAACSCGWEWNGFPDEMLSACTLHNMTHINVVRVRRLYERRLITYDGAVNFLCIISEMNEGKADELVASW